MKKHRSTPFARLFIFLLIFLPISFVGVNMAMGRDPKAEFYKLIGKDTSQAYEAKGTDELTRDMLYEENKKLREELANCLKGK